MASVEFKNIDKTYPGNAQVVKNFNLKIEDGEFIVFLGPSGCGKSTTLRMLAGLEEITSGELLIDGKIVNDVEPKERNIAMVFQSYALYPYMTVYDNIAFTLKLAGLNKQQIQEKIRPITDMLQLTPLLKRKPGALSGGQRQRVAMGRAMVRTPEVFLFDEPLSNLDAKLRNSMRSEIKLLHNKLKKTTIYVTHDQVEAMTLADRIVILRDGVIEQVGTPAEIYHRPANEFVAGFIGSPTMNLMEGTIKDVQGLHVELAGQNLPLPVKEVAVTVDQNVLIGIRPSDIHLSFDLLEHPYALKAKVETCELLGSTIHLETKIGEHTFMVETASSDIIEEGQIIDLYIDKQQVHVFDLETGTVIAA
ncbi:sugar ABC transporter ATP-binding protein [Psychromonas marina]|uniref:Sugar ABC transporter ATP-binding protein n=1 Tax=Psychromonas marina TaxID=88364 RepID=A0ABQ6E2W2_9GAMM|nr:sn-glycerol-3-phosphate ABC transporter ATP-binding protein UgpC [Psychromonas marina]GLS91751.1 sugar ABC transporter ATP-binding protein [Psychromonas marina]